MGDTTNDTTSATHSVQIALLEQRMQAVENRLDSVMAISRSVAEIEVKLDLLLQERSKAPGATNYVTWGLTIFVAMAGWLYGLLKP